MVAQRKNKLMLEYAHRVVKYDDFIGWLLYISRYNRRGFYGRQFFYLYGKNNEYDKN